MTGLSLKDEALAARFATATRDAFSDLVERAIEERVAFVLIAGDLYDREWQDNRIGLFFNREAAKLARANIPVFLIRGNHDAESIVTRTISLPAGVEEFSTRRPETREIPALRVAIHGRSFPDRAVAENWAVEYPNPRAGWFNIGLLHTSCEGSAPHDTYAPCSVADLVARGYDYWALGHIHAYQVLHREPWVVYPGNTQGRSVRETGEKGAVFVDVEDGRVTDVRRVVVDRARWIEAVVDVGGASTREQVMEAISTALRPGLELARGKLVAARVRLVGDTALNGDLQARRADLFDEAMARAQHIHEDVWLEKLSVETRAPKVARAGLDLAAVDLEAMLAEAAADPELRARAARIVADIAGKLPGKVAAGHDAPVGDLDELIGEARAVARARADSGNPTP